MKHMLPPKKLGKKVIGKAKADTEHGEAKYCITHSAIQKLEGLALEKLDGQSGIYETGELIGWCRGKDCTQIQLYVEITGYHGHPIDDELAEMR